MQPSTPPWFQLAVRLWLGFFIFAVAAYLLGASGVRLGSSTMSFGRGQDLHLRRLNDSLALDVGQYGDASVYYYHASRWPFSAVLGRYVLGRSAAQERRNPAGDYRVYFGGSHRHGDWFYTSYPQFGPLASPDAYNYHTGEILRVPGLQREPSGTPLDLATVPEFASRGLLGAETEKLSFASPLLADFVPLDMQRESLVVLLSAFLFVGLLLLLLWPLVRRRRPATGAV